MRTIEEIKADIEDDIEEFGQDTDRDIQLLFLELTNTAKDKSYPAATARIFANAQRDISGLLAEIEKLKGARWVADNPHLKAIIEKTCRLNNLMLDNDYGEDIGLFRLDRDILVSEIIAECTYLALEAMSNEHN